jgi:EAL domain-containing protein (putative c-di-GMP-specific phosphodiesterase class I)/GGDEF domain-containing protein
MSARLQRLVPEGVTVDRSRLDPITLLPNRPQFLADRAATGGVPGTLVLVTLADARAFSEILRALGHSRSDAFIRAGATRLGDILGPTVKVYHVSILSFAFHVPKHSGPERPAVIDRITTGFAAPILCDDIPIDAFVGIGLRTTTTSPDEDLRGALSAAQDSRGEATGWAWFDQRRDEAHRRAFRLLTDLKAALRSERELELHYQPKIALATGACQSVEALVRWTHPSLGPVSPGEFVPLAETTALVAPLTRWVIDAATRQMMIWQHEGLRMPVAINISPRNLEEADFVEYLLFNCAARGIDHSLVELEITEGVSAAHGPLLRDRLAALRKLGFGIAIDDFGAGYSNMAYLTRLSASTLKIDQSLVRGLEPDEQSGRLVACIVQMGHDLGYKIVAEGVETATELDLLARWGCDIGQGWHFGRPMPAAAFRDWLTERD